MSDRTHIIDLSQSDDPDLERAFIFFCRHLVSLSGSYQSMSRGIPTGEEQFFTYSGFILSIRGVWNFITAGHILKDLDHYLNEQRVKLLRCFLLDDFGPDIVSDIPIPFDYVNSSRLYIEDEQEGLDFGLIALNSHYKRLLEANGVVPVSEENWMYQHKVNFDRYFMIGLPSVFLSTDKDNDEITQNMAVTSVPLEKIEEVTQELQQTRYPRLVAKIADDCPLEEIDGMSGCPILGLSDERKNQYWVVAVQSSWLRTKRTIFTCPIPVLATLVEHLLDEFDDNAPTNESDIF